ncbi:hypothetical protein [Zavarzinia aquatilis]|uniref:Uncharacterized protein n=1 Tax=Zavarzinia aquatilis TaxID=2211142 RepID=A0A317ED67_9PROT|nr:hypothetical protein [Zavarzinia aquatilis]PWR24542.1 hypothetical protein DKG74_06980 [Zavarzinia aquatilis]
MITLSTGGLSPTDPLRWLANAAAIAESRVTFDRLRETRAAEWSERDVSDYNRAQEAEVNALQDLAALHRGTPLPCPDTITLTGPMVTLVANLVAAALSFDQSAVTMEALPDNNADWTDLHHWGANRASDDELRGWEILAGLHRGDATDMTTLRRIVFRPQVTCYWDADDREVGYESPCDIVECRDDGDIAEVEHLAIVDRTFHVTLPPAPDVDDDDEWNFVGRSLPEAQEALAAEQARRAALPAKGEETADA